MQIKTNTAVNGGVVIANGGSATFTVNSATAAPIVSNITPLSGTTGTTVTINVTGSGLPSTTVANINAQSVGCTTTSVTATGATFSCPLDVAGSQLLVIKTNTGVNGGTVINGGNATFTVASAVPGITSINPLNGTTGNTVSISISGFNLPSTIVANINAQSTGCTTTNATSGSATFSCPLDVAGSQLLVIKTNTGVNGGTVINGGNATFTVVAGPPNVSSIGPLSGTKGTTVSISVTGTNLPSTIVANINAQLTGCTTLSANSTSASFSCPLSVTGSQAMVVKTNTGANGGTVINGGSATFVVTP
ncbi:MAG: hypothetical protein H7203_09970 [Rhizobacter sp.]|nr:hypothetical protein [Burkholderiales bacterium]